MSIDGENILHSWYCNSDYASDSKKDFSELETAAKNGDEAAIDHLYGVKAELGIDVEQNIAAPEERCKNGSRQAARNLGILYHEGIAENWLLKFYALKDDASLLEEENEYVQKHLSMVASWLSWLYKKEYHKSPIHSEEKAAEWNKKYEDFKEEEEKA